MIYYILAFILFLCCCKSYYAGTIRDYDINDCNSYLKKDGSRFLVSKSEFFYFFICIGAFIIISFRGESIGTDTFVYLKKFTSIYTVESYSAYGGAASIEPIFYFLNKTLGIVTRGWSQSIIIAEGILISIGYFKIIKKYSWDPFVSLLGFVSLGLFLQSICLLRQTMAMAICAYSLKYIFERKPKKFLFFVAIAAGFHYTAVFFIVAYFVSVVMKCNKKNTALLLFLSMLGYLFTDRLQNFASTMFERWGHYAQIETDAKGYISFIVFLLITILAYMYRDDIVAECRYGGALINLNYIHMGLWLMRMVTRNAERIAFYFMIAPTFLIPLILVAIGRRYGKGVEVLGRMIVSGCMLILFLYKVSRDASCFPYVFMKF